MLLKILRHFVGKCFDIADIFFECEQHLHVVALCCLSLFAPAYHGEHTLDLFRIMSEDIALNGFACIDTLGECSTGYGDDPVHDRLLIELRHKLPSLFGECRSKQCEDHKSNDHDLFGMFERKGKQWCIDRFDHPHQW